MKDLRNNESNFGVILIATSVGIHGVAQVVNSLIGMRLYLQGADPVFLLCDAVLPACEAVTVDNVDKSNKNSIGCLSNTTCQKCQKDGESFHHPLPFPLYYYSDFVEEHDIEKAKKIASNLTLDQCFLYSRNNLDLGEQVRAGAFRFFGKATFDDEDPDFVTEIARHYLAAAIISARVTDRAIEDLKPTCIVAHHGIYVPHGVLGLVARQRGIHLVNWGPSYRNTTVIFSHGDTYHHTFLNEPVINWENRSLSKQDNKRLDEYLDQRRAGKGDWSWITPDRGENAIVAKHATLIKELGLKPGMPVFGMLTNVLWDAQLLYSNTIFPNMLEWLFTTLDFFICHPKSQLIVRIHPHEVKSGNRQPTGLEIAKRYPTLPDNIKIIDRESSFSTYALMDLCQAVFIYGTKTGVELAPFGIPVIVAGDAWIRGKGISIDISSKEYYLRLLNHLNEIAPLSPQQVERARRYAFHYFFRRMIPLQALDPEGGFPPKINITSLEDLAPGHDRGLDCICKGILEGSEFLYEPDS